MLARLVNAGKNLGTLSQSRSKMPLASDNESAIRDNMSCYLCGPLELGASICFA